MIYYGLSCKERTPGIRVRARYRVARLEGVFNKISNL